MRETALDWTGSPAGLLHRLTSHPERARQACWLAEEGGEVVGIGRARLRWEVSERAVGTFWIGVRTEGRGRGVGSALFGRVTRHLLAAGAEVFESFADEEDGRGFLARRGFRASGGEHLFVLEALAADLTALPALEESKAEEGLVLASLGNVLDRQRELHEVYAAASADIPEDFTVDDIRYEEWLDECLGDPDLSRGGSAIVLQGERPVAFAFLIVDDQGCAANEMTGTLPAFRRRGLARLAKLATIRWAARNGVATIVTGNDDDNAAMLALNRSLGYLPVAERTFYVRES
ncbi:MAG: GNAT family N-acetyltransferase [Gaiellaceae bacterium]